jgi:hypothetical protein
MRPVGLTPLPPSCAVVMKSGNLNFLEPSGPLQACNGTDVRSRMLQDTILQKYYNEILSLIASHVAIKLCNFMIP